MYGVYCISYFEHDLFRQRKFAEYQTCIYFYGNINNKVSLFKNKPSMMCAFKENLWLKISHEKYIDFLTINLGFKNEIFLYKNAIFFPNDL